MMRHIKKKVKAYMLAIMPNIAKSGLQSIDEKKKKEDTFQMIAQFGNLMKNKMMNDEEEEKTAFEVFTKNLQ